MWQFHGVGVGIKVDQCAPGMQGSAWPWPLFTQGPRCRGVWELGGLMGQRQSRARAVCRLVPSYLNSGGPGSEGGAAVRTVRPAGGSLCRSRRGSQRPQLTRAQRAVVTPVPRTLRELQGDPEREVLLFLFLEGGGSLLILQTQPGEAVSWLSVG